LGGLQRSFVPHPTSSWRGRIKPNPNGQLREIFLHSLTDTSSAIATPNPVEGVGSVKNAEAKTTGLDAVRGI